MEKELHVQRPECKELPGPQAKEEGSILSSWGLVREGGRWSMVLSGRSLATISQMENWRLRERTSLAKRLVEAGASD